MERPQASVVLHNYATKFYLLTDYPPHDLMREMTQDANTLINYVLAYVISTSEGASELPKFMENTLTYIVNFRAANFTASEGGMLDAGTLLTIKGQLNVLMIEMLRELSATPYWFNHDLRFIGSGYGEAFDWHTDPSLGVVFELGEVKLGDVDSRFSHNVSPQILTGLEMLVMRYEAS